MKTVLMLLAVALTACASSADSADGTEDLSSTGVQTPSADAERARVRAITQCDCVKDNDGNMVCSDCHTIGSTYTSGAGNIW